MICIGILQNTQLDSLSVGIGKYHFCHGRRNVWNIVGARCRVQDPTVMSDMGGAFQKKLVGQNGSLTGCFAVPRCKNKKMNAECLQM